MVKGTPEHQAVDRCEEVRVTAISQLAEIMQDRETAQLDYGTLGHGLKDINCRVSSNVVTHADR